MSEQEYRTMRPAKKLDVLQVLAVATIINQGPAKHCMLYKC